MGFGRESVMKRAEHACPLELAGESIVLLAELDRLVYGKHPQRPEFDASNKPQLHSNKDKIRYDKIRNDKIR